jgi:phytanoyl-CoA hydroxylase
MRLTASQIDRFDEEGYLVVENALHDSDLDPVIHEYEGHIGELAQGWMEAGEISSLHEGEQFETRLARICEESPALGLQASKLMDLYHARGRRTFEFLRNDNLMDLVEGLVGPEIICSPIQHVRAKLPSRLFFMTGGDSHVAAWHQDAGVTMDDADPHFILTVWIPLTKATRENGCMQIIPRTNKGKLLEHQIVPGIGTRIREDEMPPIEPVDLEMEKGGVVLIHKNVPHRSTPNNSNGIRWSMDLRYQKTGTSTGRTIYPDFVVRSRANPASVLTDHEEWSRMWIEALEAESPADRHHRWETVHAD